MGLVLWAFVVLFWVFSFRGNENRVRGKDERSRLVLFQVPWVRARLVFFFCWREISESRRDPRRSRTCGCCTWVTILHAWRVTRRNPQATRSSALNTPARADARGGLTCGRDMSSLYCRDRGHTPSRDCFRSILAFFACLKKRREDAESEFSFPFTILVDFRSADCIISNENITRCL